MNRVLTLLCGTVAAAGEAISIVLAQIAFYAGIYDPQKGCPAIGFEGGNHWHSLQDITYPDPERFLSRARTADGNYA